MKSALSLTLIVCLVASALPVAAQEPETARLAATGEPPLSGVDVVQQGGPSFDDLHTQLKPDDTIFVTDSQGRETRGTLVRLLAASLVILVNGDEREIAFTSIARIEKRSTKWIGASIGAALLGPAFAAGVSLSGSDAAIVGIGIAGGVLGAVIGGHWDRSRDDRTTVYGAHPDSRRAIRPSGPVTSLGDLWMKVKSGDTIQILEANARETHGEFAHISASSIGLLIDGQLREIPASEVRQVARRGDRLWTGLLIGATLGTIGGAINSHQFGTCRGGGTASGGVHHDAGCAIVTVGYEAAVGAVVGKLIPKRTVVYRSAASGAAPSSAGLLGVIPIITPNTKGVRQAFGF